MSKNGNSNKEHYHNKGQSDEKYSKPWSDVVNVIEGSNRTNHTEENEAYNKGWSSTHNNDFSGSRKGGKK